MFATQLRQRGSMNTRAGRHFIKRNAPPSPERQVCNAFF